MSDVLARILADKRRAIEAAKAARPLALLEREAAAATPPRGFVAALGVNIDADAELVRRAMVEAGIGFLMAPRYHGAMRH
ncbi:MAG TPA: hypothetical protein VF502_13590, partial [Stellaceae bacterium]